MHLEGYLEARFPAPCRVLGVGLQRCSVGHLMLMQWLHSPFVGSDRAPELGDLLAAVEICRYEFPNAMEIVYRLKQTQAKLRRKAFLCRLISARTIADEILQFQLYIAAARSVPPLCYGESGREVGAPFEQRLEMFLRHHFGLSELEALNMPLSKATWDYLAYMESESAVEIENQTHRDMLDTIRSMGCEPIPFTFTKPENN